MKKTLLASVALLGLTVGQAQAVSLTPDLTFTGDYSFDGDIDLYEFNVNNAGAVSIWVDTLEDGLDSAGFLFMKNASGGYDYVKGIANADEVYTPNSDNTGVYNFSGINAFDVAIKNGYNVGVANGVSDTGGTVNLDAGQYLYAQTGFLWAPNADSMSAGTGTLADGWMDFNFFGDPEFSWSSWTYSTGGSASMYEVYIAGDVSEVSAVPVPAAVWLFSSAILGLGAVSRKKHKAIV